MNSVQIAFLIGCFLGGVVVLDCVAFHHCRVPRPWIGIVPFFGFICYFKQKRA